MVFLDITCPSARVLDAVPAVSLTDESFSITGFYLFIFLLEHKIPSETFIRKHPLPTHTLQSWTCHSLGMKQQMHQDKSKLLTAF